MEKNIRFDAWGLIEAQFEPGSRGRVHRNLLGIKRKREMDEIEAREYSRALGELTSLYDRNHRFTADDICQMHRIWLGPVYEWAGHYRQVKAGMDDFLFAGADCIPGLMAEFEEGPLREFTPCRFASTDEIERAIAVVHTELVLIHPFHLGNERVARLLSILMALQAGLPPLDFGGLRGKKLQQYFVAVKAGMERNYEPMERIVSSVIRRTLRTSRVPSVLATAFKCQT